MPIQITAVVCTFNRCDLLRAAVGSLLEQSLAQTHYNVLVIDNSPSGAAVQALAGEFSSAPVRLIHETSLGLSHARNRALAEAEAPLVAFLDDDALAHRDWLERMVAFFAEHDDSVAGVGGPVEPLWEAPRPSWLPDRFLSYLSAIDWGDATFPVDAERYLIGTNVAYRREAVLAAGGFRTDLGRRGTSLISNEEIELHQRLQAAGKQVYYTPGVRVRHRVPAERLTQAWLRKRIFWQVISDLLAGNQPPPSKPGWSLFGETQSARTFERECRRLVLALQDLSHGKKR